MKKLLIAALSVFVLINISFAQSTQQQAQKGKELRQDEQKLGEITKALNSAKNAQNNERQSAEELYKQRFPEFVASEVDESVKNYIVKELMKNPNWEITDIYLTKDGRYIVKSTSNSKGVELKLNKKAYEWHKNKGEFLPLYAMQNSVIRAVDEYTDYGEKWADEVLVNNNIVKLKCRQVKLLNREISPSAYVKIENENGNIYKVYGIIYAKCISDGNKQTNLFYIPITIPANYDLMFDIMHDATLSPYLYQGTFSFGRSVYKKSIRIDSIPLKEIETFNLEDFKIEDVALKKMQKAVVDYYKNYTGRTYDIKNAIINKECKTVSFYYIDAPKQNNSNFNFNQNNNSAFMEKQKEAEYIYAVCGSDRKDNIIIRPNHSYFDKIYVENHPRKTIKTFKREDYK